MTVPVHGNETLDLKVVKSVLTQADCDVEELKGVAMTTYRYTVLLEHGESEDVWVAIVPALPGCVTQGASIEETLIAASGHVEGLVALGEHVPTESGPTIVTTIAVDIDLAASPELVGAAD